MKYTAEEVRETERILRKHSNGPGTFDYEASDMLTAYAERIEADEESAVGYVATDNKIVFYVEDGWSKEVPPGTKLFTHPPAQAAAQGGVPDGWVLVPREPTKAMLAAYEHVRSGADWQENVFRLTKKQLARHKAAYTAMLEAALQEKSP